MTKQLSAEIHERHTYRFLKGFDGHSEENLKQEAQIVINID